MKNILVVFGTRPEAIKMAPVVLELSKRPTQFRVTTCVTAQHREMLDQVLELFEIKPDFDLNVMMPGQDLYELTARVLVGMRDVLRSVQPNLCLVHGDTTTTMAASLAAFYQRLPVGHVEAGLRTYQPYAPFPEEINRSLTGRIARFHFAPTAVNRDNLLKEGVAPETVVVTGNTVIDALFWTVDRIRAYPARVNMLAERIRQHGYPLTDRKILLVTGHRRENFGEGFRNICRALLEIAIARPDVDIVYPVHLNPNVKIPVEQLLSSTSNIYLVAPLDYQTFTYLMMRSYVILTDSGGIQEEGPSLGKPVLVMREFTERPDGVDAGTVQLVGTAVERITRTVMTLLENETAYTAMTKIANPYGDGTAAQKIADFLANIDMKGVL